MPRKPKILIAEQSKFLVEIIGANCVKSRKTYEVDGDSIVIRKAKRGRGPPAYKPTFNKDCILNYWKGIWPFKKLKQRLMLKEGANECVNFYGGEEVDVPTFDRKASEKLFQANVIKSAGSTTTKVQVPLSLYLFMGIIAVLAFVNILISTGRVRFG